MSCAGSSRATSRCPSPICSYYSRPGSSEKELAVGQEAVSGINSKLFTAKPWRKRKDRDESDPTKSGERAEKRTRKTFFKIKAHVEGSPCCKENCVGKLTPGVVLSLASNAAAESFQERSTRLDQALQACCANPDVPHKQFEYRVLGQRVCQSAFAFYHGVTQSTVSRKCGEQLKRSGVLPRNTVHAKFGTTAPSEGREDCAEWLHGVLVPLAQPFPQHTIHDKRTGEVKTKELLPSGLFHNMRSVYDHYVGTTTAQGRTPVSYCTFLRAWEERHYQVCGTTPFVACSWTWRTNADFVGAVTAGGGPSTAPCVIRANHG